ncbi:MAG: hypothetical protein SCARUB_02410 [Candidatus Scalindua rubra]|uniref:HD-GYP domain-containing protein n=1 Tax=Candidatus Scalindua rubra TaxID=1872076 RepID=A0A1E3XA09_9BACT|nr:MAG: hypothetical protein SCARUB_02410 [Candidatus Scalindua rubra]
MNNNKYVTISTEDLIVNTILNFDIFIKSKDQTILFRKKDHPFTAETLSKLVEHKIQSLLISEDEVVEFEKYYHNVRQNTITSLTKKGFSPPVFDQPENVKKYYNSHFNYYPIEKATLIPDSTVSFSVYKKTLIDVELYFGPENQNGKSNIVPADIQETSFPIVISNTDISLYRKYLQDTTKEYFKQNYVSPELQCSVIRENSKLIIKEVLEDPRNGENIEKSRDLVETLANTILDNKDNFCNLLKITSHDYYTYMHSLNVCTLSIGIGEIILKLERPVLNEMGLGALLHDIGKCTIDPRIINKPGRLTPEEFKSMQNHVLAAKGILSAKNGSIPQRSLFPILQHHERISGNGYPYKKKGDQIHLFGRVAAIVDFYDALTTDRPYKKAYSPFETLQLLTNAQEDFDQSLVKAFIIMLGKQAKAQEQKAMTIQQL